MTLLCFVNSIVPTRHSLHGSSSCFGLAHSHGLLVVGDPVHSHGSFFHRCTLTVLMLANPANSHGSHACRPGTLSRILVFLFVAHTGALSRCWSHRCVLTVPSASSLDPTHGSHWHQADRFFFFVDTQPVDSSHSSIQSTLLLGRPTSSFRQRQALVNTSVLITQWCSLGAISSKCWIERSICLLKQISLLEIVAVWLLPLLLLLAVDLEVETSKMPLLQMHTSSNSKSSDVDRNSHNCWSAAQAGRHFIHHHVLFFPMIPTGIIGNARVFLLIGRHDAKK